MVHRFISLKQPFTPGIALCHDARIARYTVSFDILGHRRSSMEAAGSIAAAVRRVSIQDFVNKLQKLEDRDFETVDAPLAYLRANPVDPDSLQPYLFWNQQHYRSEEHTSELQSLRHLVC